MAWLSRVNFISSDTLSFTDVNNLGNDIRAWGDNVNGGGYTLSNVVLSASSGTMATVIGGTGTTSTLTLRSTSGVGTTGADIIFQAGNNGATEVMRLQNGGNVGIGTSSPGTKLNVVSGNVNSVADPFGAAGSFIATSALGGQQANSVLSVSSNDAVAANVGGVIGLGGRYSGTAQAIWASIVGFKENATSGEFGGYMAFYTRANGQNNFERMRIDPVGNVKVGGTADRATTAGTNQVVIFDGTAPVGTLANGCSFYSTAGEMRVMDAAGNATLLSPHDSQTNEWIYDSSHTPTGKRLKIDVERLLRFLNDHFGLDCVHDFIQEN